VHASRRFPPAPFVAACCALCGLRLAAAQTGSSVQFYGIVDSGFASVDRGTVSQRLLVSGGQGASRWGFRGTEDLGAGLAAVFNLEAQFSSDDGTMTAPNGGFMRRSVVGLRGPWGEVTLGRDFTPSYWGLLENDIGRFGLFGTLQSINSFGIATPRASNGVFYATPEFSGFQLRAMHALGEGPANAPHAGDIYGAGLRYQFKAFSANLSMLRLKTVAPGTTQTGPSALVETRQMVFGAGYDFGPVRVTAGGGHTDPDGRNNRISYGHLGAAMPVGAGQFLVQATRFKGQAGRARATTLGVSYAHYLSRRTNLYASWGRTANNATGRFPLNISQSSFAPTAPGANVRGIMVGVRHLF
jgi:predicted porin